jgi:hypothetical protein
MTLQARATETWTNRFDEESSLAVSLTTSDDGRALLLTTLDVIHDAVVLNLRYLRSLVGSLLERVSGRSMIDPVATD